MDIEIKRLSPELVEDYLSFFDMMNSIGKKEYCCYCVCWAATIGELNECTTAVKQKEIAKRYIKNNYLQGYLAYHEDQVVGWCNTNTRSDCYECISWQFLMNGVKTDDKKVKSLFCFEILPDFRGMGIASMLLERVCEDAEKDGYDYIEAYPNINFVDEEQDFMGPVKMYEKFGFTVCYKVKEKYVMRKSLK